MIRTGTLEKAREGRRHLVLPNGTGYWRNGLITTSPDAAVGLPSERALAPQAFLVEQDPGSTIEPHFHQENEFQVVVEGDGLLGRHVVEPVRVHYAGAHTGYGPVVAGPKGLSYFTLRARTDPGAQFLPGARDKLGKGRKRHLLSRAWPPLPAADLAVSGGSEAMELWEPQPDGIGAWMLRVAPDSAASVPGLASASRYLLVIGGALIINGERLPRFAAIFISNNETLALRAAKEGLELLVLEFPGTQEEWI